MNYIIVNNRNELFEYTEQDSVKEALCSHIDASLTPSEKLSIEDSFLDIFFNSVTGIRDIDLVELLNFLCKKDKYKIKRIFAYPAGSCLFDENSIS